MGYQIIEGREMFYLLHQNGQKHLIKPGTSRFVNFIDASGKETLYVSLIPGPDGVTFRTKYPVEYIIGDKKQSAFKDELYIEPLNEEIIFLTDCVEIPRITVRVVRLDPVQSPSPPPEDKTRAPTIEYEPAPPAKKPPANQSKKRKRTYKEFHMW